MIETLKILPHELDDIDVKIITELLKDGRKSFRQISKEITISTPTVKARYQRLVNLGLIKSISPILDMSKITKQTKIQITNKAVPKDSKFRIESGQGINVNCAYCKGVIHGIPKILKFAEHERFFCCSSCKSLYKEKYGGRINSILKKKIER
jgi:Lrp/AsnC family leucine-responsive transcriptional regulator